MNQLITNKVTRIVITVITAIVLVITAVSLYNTLVFRVVSTDPVMHNFSTSVLFIKVSFNKPLLTHNLSVTGSDNLVDSYSVNGSVITILINSPLDAGKQYQLNILGISDTKGQKLANQVFKFTPQNLPESILSTAQKTALDKAQSDYHALVSDPLIALLPFSGGGNEFVVSYTVQYVHRIPKPTIVITAPTQVGQVDGLAWLKLIGADPTKYQIQYVTGPVQ